MPKRNSAPTKKTKAEISKEFRRHFGIQERPSPEPTGTMHYVTQVPNFPDGAVDTSADAGSVTWQELGRRHLRELDLVRGGADKGRVELRQEAVAIAGLPVTIEPVRLPLHDDDRLILVVLRAHKGKALSYRQIVRESSKMNRDDRQSMPRRLSDNAVRTRMPFLLDRHQVARPAGTRKKGVGITDIGRKDLEA